jgi:hypothetical protein
MREHFYFMHSITKIAKSQRKKAKSWILGREFLSIKPFTHLITVVTIDVVSPLVEYEHRFKSGCRSRHVNSYVLVDVTATVNLADG